MFGSSILEVAIGLVFVYLLLSLMCSAVNEIIEAKLKNRATDLERGIRELFDEENGGGIVEKFYKHPLIYGLYSGKYQTANKKIGFWDYLKKTNLPSYIPSANFAQAILDIVFNDVKTENISADVNPGQESLPAADDSPNSSLITVRSIQSATQNPGSSKFQLALRALAQQSEGDVNKLRENIEAWFNSSMDRVSGWYTRRTKWIIIAIGLILTIGININTITIAKRLSNDNTLRNAIVAQAEKTASDSLPGANFEENKKQLESLGLPIGRENFGWYSGEFELWNHLFLHLFGWLLTVMAISLGAPFWFDVLNKFMVIRSTVKPHEKSPEESSEDRQLLRKPATVLALTAGTQVPGSSSGK